MNIIYFSSSCSKNKFNKLRQNGTTRKLPQAQKYHRLMMEGLKENIDGNLTAISVFPVNREWTKQVTFPREEEMVSGIYYIYSQFVNYPVIKQISIVVNIKREVKKLMKRNHGQTIIICDILNQTLAKGARQIGKKYGLPVLGIVTDVPGHTSGARRKDCSFFKRKLKEYAEMRCCKTMMKYDAYLFLTDAMSDIVNLNYKPYVVIEGQADISLADVDNIIENKSIPKVIMYAGGIHKEFGIPDLVQAFIAGHFDDWELHIYGDGNFQRELEDIVSRNKAVKYFGVQSNELIVEKQIKATLLVNPRFTAAEYVKYSFPSKTLESMISGTPLLTTRLPGMPKDYYDYVYLFNEETENGFLNVLSDVLNYNSTELHEMGCNAKLFAINNKNNIKQAEKLTKFISEKLLGMHSNGV